MSLQISQNITLIDTIKEGGTATLHLGVDTYSGLPVAVKELKSGYFKNTFVRQKFVEEANQYLYLRHPGIVKLKDFIAGEQNQYLVMEYVDGHDLSDHLKKISGPLTLVEVASMMNEVLGALNYIHQKGLVHLDIKPSNIMLTKENHIKLVDFGITHDVNTGHIQNIMGTPYYMSPEQILGKQPDNRSDIYAVGITIYELLSGKVPFFNAANREALFDLILNQPLPPLTPFHAVSSEELTALKKIVQKATFKDPNARYQHAEDLQRALLQFIH